MMTVDFNVFLNAIRQGNWPLIPAVILFAGLCIGACYFTPRALRCLDGQTLIRSAFDPHAPDLPERLWNHFTSGLIVACRPMIKIAVTAIFLAGVFFASAAGLNLLVGGKIVSFTADPDADYTAALAVLGGILISTGASITFYYRAAPKREEGIWYYIFRFIFIAATLSLFAGIVLWILSANGILILPDDIIFASFGLMFCCYVLCFMVYTGATT